MTPRTMFVVFFFFAINAYDNTRYSKNGIPWPNRRNIHPISEQNGKIYTLFRTRNARKWYPLGRHTPIWLIYGSTPPPPPLPPGWSYLGQSCKRFFREKFLLDRHYDGHRSLFVSYNPTATAGIIILRFSLSFHTRTTRKGRNRPVSDWLVHSTNDRWTSSMSLAHFWNFCLSSSVRVCLMTEQTPWLPRIHGKLRNTLSSMPW